MSGIAVRINQLRNSEYGTSAVVAFDHGFNGIVPGGEDARGIIEALAVSDIDGILIGPGLLRQLSPLLAHPGAPRVIATLDGGTFGALPGVDHPLTHARRAVSPEWVLRHGAVAAKMILPLGLGDTEALAEATSLLGRTAAECEELGLPFMIEPAFWGAHLEKVDDEMIRHAARQATELGATILKLPAPSRPEILSEIISHTGLPVWVLGGAPQSGGGIGSAIVEWIDAGALGVAIGRNIWSRPNMVAAVEGLKAAVHHRDAARAEELFHSADLPG